MYKNDGERYILLGARLISASGRRLRAVTCEARGRPRCVAKYRDTDWRVEKIGVKVARHSEEGLREREAAFPLSEDEEHRSMWLAKTSQNLKRTKSAVNY